MKRMHFDTIILLVLGGFLFVSGMSEKSIFSVVGLGVMALGIVRFFLIRQAMLYQDDETDNSEDMIVTYLKRHPRRNAHMLYSYRYGNAKLLYGENDGVLLYDEKMDYYLASALTTAAVKDILALVPNGFTCFIANDALFKDEVEAQLTYRKRIDSYNWVYESKQHFDVSANVELRHLDQRYIKQVEEQYTISDLCPDGYISQCIEMGMLGAFIDDKLVGFIGKHTYGPIGLLEVSRDYQGQHLGTLLLASFINEQLDLNPDQLLFAQTNALNDISIHLMEKLGFRRADQAVYWYTK